MRMNKYMSYIMLIVILVPLGIANQYITINHKDSWWATGLFIAFIVVLGFFIFLYKNTRR